MTETFVIAKSDYAFLIEQGIKDAKGSEKAIEFLTEEDLKNIGKMLADRETKIQNIFSVVVDPINNISTAIEKGNYNYVYYWINEKHVPLQKVAGSKRIYFVPVTEEVNTGYEESYVNKFGLTLCKNAPNYLAGAMAILSENKIPAELKSKDFVAVENNLSSIFKDDDSDRCFLYVSRVGYRRLLLIILDGLWGVGHNWMFLAEKP